MTEEVNTLKHSRMPTQRPFIYRHRRMAPRKASERNLLYNFKGKALPILPPESMITQMCRQALQSSPIQRRYHVVSVGYTHKTPTNVQLHKYSNSSA
jgi:hypothetical protein